MKKLVCLFVLVVALFLPLLTCASEEISVSAKGAALIDGASGRVLFSNNADQMLPMASTTKIMTALLALENAKLTDRVTASANASGVPGTSIYLSVGETLTMEQMLYGLLLRSGNDAAVAIAEHVAGDVPTFVEMMNARAAEMGVDAHFENPHGLDEAGHSASALAMAQMLREAMRNPDFREITGTQKKVIPWVESEFSRVLSNKNRLLRTCEGATGGKTGFTDRAGRCLVFSAEREGMELFGAVLNCPAWFDEAEEMLNYGFEHYHLETALVAGAVACETGVSGGMADKVEAVADRTLAAAVGEDERWSVRYDFGDGVRAPVARGEAIGTATLSIDGQPVASCKLLAKQSVEDRSMMKALKRILMQWLLNFRS
ncbi:MAG: D-alanyl-D-alanine carboxypeptidase [Clostridiales bacterium]|jgi:D-alanyl-D-alanine carboxypeptidase (penicillin-binding protein 5/6)|nr:D-alanyl-D-alanine carboxypeptidase [Clostridiales bacterium]